jgi:cytochrome c oxidase subunit 2
MDTGFNVNTILDFYGACCHQKTGLGLPPVFPAMKGSKIANGPVADHINIVLHGKGAMPVFKS